MNIISIKRPKYWYIDQFGEKHPLKNIIEIVNKNNIQLVNSLTTFRIINFQTNLYVYNVYDNIYITENIKYIFSSNCITPQISHQSKLLYYLAGFIFAPWTIFSNLFLMCPGYLYTLESTVFEINADIVKQNKRQYNLYEFLEIIEQGFHKNDIGGKSVDYLLSGGLDSSLLLYIGVKNLKLTGRSITARMSGFAKEVNTAKAISDELNIDNKLYVYSQDSSNYAIDYSDYVSHTYLPVSDPAMPIVNDMLKGFKTQPCYLIDGQGADSVCFGLPHNTMLSYYNKYIYWLYKIIGRTIIMPQNKSKNLGRYIYRLNKINYCLGQQSHAKAYLASFLGVSEIPGNDIYNNAANLFEWCFSKYANIHHAIGHIMLYCVIPSREMSKYVLPRSKGMNFILPFLERDLIDYTFSTPISCYFTKKIRKKALFKLADQYYPKLFAVNRTSPFYINYSVNNSLEDPLDYDIRDTLRFQNTVDMEQVKRNFYSLKILESTIK